MAQRRQARAVKYGTVKSAMAKYVPGSGKRLAGKTAGERELGATGSAYGRKLPTSTCYGPPDERRSKEGVPRPAAASLGALGRGAARRDCDAVCLRSHGRGPFLPSVADIPGAAPASRGVWAGRLIFGSRLTGGHPDMATWSANS